MRRLFNLPADLMQIDHGRAAELLVEAEAAGHESPLSAIRSRGDLALSVHHGLDADRRAAVSRPGLKTWCSSLGRSKSTAHRVRQRWAREAGRLPPPDKIRDELRMALNAVRRARRMIVADNCLATADAWDELRALITEIEELNALGG